MYTVLGRAALVDDGSGGLYLHRNSGSETSFTSIDTVTDLGFTRQGNSRGTIDLSETRHEEKEPSRPGDSRQGLSRTNTSSAHSNDSSEETETDFASALNKRLWNLRTESRNSKDKSEQKYFYPIDGIQEVVAPRNVRKILRAKIPYLLKDESERLTQDICGAPQGTLNEGQSQQAPRQRLFAILLLADRIECIGCFVKCGVNDSDLPLYTSNDLKLYSKHDTARNNPLKCFQGWKTLEIEWFITHQYQVLSPFFDLDPQNVCLYLLPSGILLPFVEYEEGREGGQGSVGKVLIHPAHHNFTGGEKTENPYFAVKKLYSHNHEDYRKEVEVHQRFSGKKRGHPHLVRLLLTYRHGDDFHMLFCWADGNLRDFWESQPSPERTQALACWMLNQCHGIADGLREIHGNIPKDGDLTPTGKNTGRHGDIKPENILWLKRHGECDNHLLISDFGMTRFHSFRSHSGHSLPGCSPTYRPPECDLPWLKISVKYDIWTLGCLFLDFITWYLLGFDAVDRVFADARLKDEGWTPNMKPSEAADKRFFEDKFFMTYNEWNRKGAKLKPSVMDWIEKLHKLEYCPAFAHDFLGVLQQGLLIPNKKSRWDCQEIVRKLDEIRKKCESNDAYCVNPCPWSGETVDTPTVSGVGKLTARKPSVSQPNRIYIGRYGEFTVSSVPEPKSLARGKTFAHTVATARGSPVTFEL
ncbi:hypothetical protein MFIFM68171_06576 [Madurella fahalii]|uniref:Protein kinase domain-containing protein n=1 Tax=Madurella fahalii TaxID=1157608 RepID=A0ABQ0GF18_9PEZI